MTMNKSSLSIQPVNMTRLIQLLNKWAIHNFARIGAHGAEVKPCVPMNIV